MHSLLQDRMTRLYAEMVKASDAGDYIQAYAIETQMDECEQMTIRAEQIAYADVEVADE